jgi:DNA-binding transcriptional regulator YdaS (Cro superfamily)
LLSQKGVLRDELRARPEEICDEVASEPEEVEHGAPYTDWLRTAFVAITGTVGDQRELAELMGLTRARVTQLLDLVLLAPDIQEQLLDGAVGTERVTERALRPVVCVRCWEEQRRLWASLSRPSVR